MRAFGRPLTTWADVQAKVEQLVGPPHERRSQKNRHQVSRPFELKRESDRSVRETTRTIVIRDWQPSLELGSELGSTFEVRAFR